MKTARFLITRSRAAFLSFETGKEKNTAKVPEVIKKYKFFYAVAV